MTSYLEDIDYNVKHIIDNINSGDGAEDAHRYWLAQLCCWHEDMPEWERDQFSEWYSQQQHLWKPVSLAVPSRNVFDAYQAWIRRP